MPLTLTLTEGVLPGGTEKIAVARITEAFLAHHGMAENAKMRENVTAHLVVLPKGATFRGGEEFAGAWIEWKVPSFALADRDVQKGFFAEATDILHALSEGRQPRDRIYANVVHAVDGSWNMDGVAMSTAEVIAAVSES
jgi:hypothetical protein